VYAALLVLLALGQPTGAQTAAEPLVGVVVSPDGKPLDGVEVLLASAR
jgi:hypothetical protein